MADIITADLVARVCPVCGTTKHVGRGHTWPQNSRTTEVSAFPGTLLDYFAGQIISGMMAAIDARERQFIDKDAKEKKESPGAFLAREAYGVAVAMLAEKEKREWVKVEPPPLGKLREAMP